MAHSNTFLGTLSIDFSRSKNTYTTFTFSMILFWHPSQDKHNINCSSLRHKAKLHFIHTHYLTKPFHHHFHHLHSMLKKLNGSIATAVPDITLPRKNLNYYAYSPFIWYSKSIYDSLTSDNLVIRLMTQCGYPQIQHQQSQPKDNSYQNQHQQPQPKDNKSPNINNVNQRKGMISPKSASKFSAKRHHIPPSKQVRQPGLRYHVETSPAGGASNTGRQRSKLVPLRAHQRQRTLIPVRWNWHLSCNRMADGISRDSLQGWITFSNTCWEHLGIKTRSIEQTC